MRRIILCIVFLIFLLSWTVFVYAQSDDITLMGPVKPVYALDNAFTATVVTSTDENLTIEISDIAVESERILLRFFVSELSHEWKEKITDDSRLYGSYLPVAEILLNDGTILTPSSASRYSFLEYNGLSILGGLLIFDTAQIPQAFYLSFNQLPFDTQPLSESFSKAVILSSSENRAFGTREQPASKSGGIEFSLTAAAQSSNYTMLQPSVKMIREDEILSKFGWIYISDAESGKYYAVTRGNLYGFNLTDDSVYAPAHSYVFSALTDETPLVITMEYAYIVRSYDSAQKSILDLTGAEQSVLLQDENFLLKASLVESFPDEDRIRVYIDSGESQITDISFNFRDLIYAVTPSVNCGMDPISGGFACDFYFNDVGFPLNALTLEIDAVEYREDGPWRIEWTPVPMEAQNQTPSALQAFSPAYSYDYADLFTKEQPAEVQRIQDSLAELEVEFTKTPGWIHESYELDYRFSEHYFQDLIPVDQYEQYYTHYISENWYLIVRNSAVEEIISLIRDTENGKIISAQLQQPGRTLDLIHALSANNNQPHSEDFQAFPGFTEVIQSSAVFLSEEDCSSPNSSQKCLAFFQSLNGNPDSPNGQRIRFQIDENNNFILAETISYDQGALELTKTTLALEKAESLPEDVLELQESVK